MRPELLRDPMAPGWLGEALEACGFAVLVRLRREVRGVLRATLPGPTLPGKGRLVGVLTFSLVGGRC
ncbi:hypothetical protein Asi03nite_42550 [Actinoplanes siamensis]|uniref:Uncharacterized protein n=1 Tax=Actinoplanes siamensis TaxID=1223317 RepID=A0A919N8Z9_9ACTN|nr:hypothetical protein Asi03nite_42550 [Actinoplanes siamensis]